MIEPATQTKLADNCFFPLLGRKSNIVHTFSPAGYQIVYKKKYLKSVTEQLLHYFMLMYHACCFHFSGKLLFFITICKFLNHNPQWFNLADC